MSFSSKSSKDLYFPVKNPLPRGEYVTTATPSSRHVLRRLVPVSLSMSNDHGLYSIWTAEMGCTAYPRRRVSEEHSENPMYLILPALFAKFSIAVDVLQRNGRD